VNDPIFARHLVVFRGLLHHCPDGFQKPQPLTLRSLLKDGEHVSIAQSRIMFAGVILLLVSRMSSAQSQSQAQLSPSDLIRAVIHSELKTSDVTEIRWKYLVNKDVDGKQETREVVETKSGSLDRLIAIAGRPLSDAQQRDETERILRLSHNPEEQHKLEQTRRKDAEQCNAFLQMVPDAFLFEYAGESGDLTKLTFKPNPAFRPPSREGKVLHEMAGEIWVDAKQQRLVSINGQLMNEVKCAGGLWVRHEEGGQFSVKRAEVAPAHWEVTEMAVNMRGKALLFKTISVQQKELHQNFERVRDDLTMSDAAALLLKQALIAANH